MLLCTGAQAVNNPHLMSESEIEIEKQFEFVFKDVSY